MDFTIEEENLICIFNTNNRNACIIDISAAILDFHEPELCEIAGNVLKKLQAMSDEEFCALTFNPEYNDEEMEV